MIRYYALHLVSNRKGGEENLLNKSSLERKPRGDEDEEEEVKALYPGNVLISA